MLIIASCNEHQTENKHVAPDSVDTSALSSVHAPLPKPKIKTGFKVGEVYTIYGEAATPFKPIEQHRVIIVAIKDEWVKYCVYPIEHGTVYYEHSFKDFAFGLDSNWSK